MLNLFSTNSIQTSLTFKSFNVRLVRQRPQAPSSTFCFFAYSLHFDPTYIGILFVHSCLLSNKIKLNLSIEQFLNSHKID